MINNLQSILTTVEEYEELETAYEMPEDPCSGEDFNPNDWELIYVKLVDKFEQSFFIRENAERFLVNQRHNFSSPYIFVESACRNVEWQQIRELLIDKAQIECDNVTA